MRYVKSIYIDVDKTDLNRNGNRYNANAVRKVSARTWRNRAVNIMDPTRYLKIAFSAVSLPAYRMHLLGLKPQ